MKFVSFGTVLIALLLSMYILLSISATQQKPIHLQSRKKMEKTFLLKQSYVPSHMQT